MTRSVSVVPVSDERWPELVDLFGPRGADAGCWCMFFRVRSSEWSWSGSDERRDQLRALAAKDPAPGLVAYDGDHAVGWVGLGPRPSFERLARSRKYPALDDLPVWSVVCFFIRKSARGQRVAAALLDAAIRYAREQGAAGLEGYAVEPQERMRDADAYHGTVGLFERAGFRRARKAESAGGRHDRWIMRLEFA